MNAADRRRLTPLLASVAAVLLLILIVLWLGLGRGTHWRGVATAARLPPAGSGLRAPVVPALDQYAAVWQRPLFSPTRTPQPDAGEGGAASGDLQLTGVIMQPGLRMAIVHDATTHKDYRIIAGRPSDGGPVLVALHPRSAVIAVAGSRRTLRLVPGPAPAAENGAATADTGQGGSAMVARRSHANTQPHASLTGTGAEQAADLRGRALRARLEALRQRAAQPRGSG